MGHAIALRPDFTATELRRLATRTKDVAQARRLLAIAAIVDGASRAEAARIGGMDHATTTFLRPASMMTGDNRKKFCGQSSDHPLSGPPRWHWAAGATAKGFVQGCGPDTEPVHPAPVSLTDLEGASVPTERRVHFCHLQ